MIERLRPWHNSGLQYVIQPDFTTDWPEGWQSLWSKANPAKTIWTYAELGDDMGEQPDCERRTALVSLIQTLSWPKGCITFWPLNAPQEEPKPWLFWRGVHRISANIILLFGEEAAEILGLSWGHGLKQYRDNNLIVTFHSLLDCARDQNFSADLKFLLEGSCP